MLFRISTHIETRRYTYTYALIHIHTYYYVLTHIHAHIHTTCLCTVPLVIKTSDVWITVSLIDEIQVTITFNVSNFVVNIIAMHASTSVYFEVFDKCMQCNWV